MKPCKTCKFASKCLPSGFEGMVSSVIYWRSIQEIREDSFIGGKTPDSWDEHCATLRRQLYNNEIPVGCPSAEGVTWKAWKQHSELTPAQMEELKRNNEAVRKV